MEMYKQAVRDNLLFKTEKGVLSIQELYTLSVPSLEREIRSINKKLKEQDKDDNELSFLGNTTSSKNKEDVLRFEILKDIYLTKKQEEEEADSAKAKKENNQKILNLIAKKQEQSLESLSIEDLQKLLQ